MKFLSLWLAVLAPIIACSQGPSKFSKYSIGIEVNVGHSFPNLQPEQTHWKGTFYPAGGISLCVSNRINQKWISDLGIGITGYALTNKGSVDKYVLNFASPTISTGISYNFFNRKGKENFLKVTTGLQAGYQGAFTDEFETYSVEIEGKSIVYPYVRPEIGIRRYFKKRMKGSRFKMAYEFGTFFRYNILTLGKVTITEQDFEIAFQPNGNILGGYFKVLFPTGRKRVKMKKESAKELPPIIYNPRFLK
ncbi:MAG: hypothetical protein KDC24_10745 [Saprospiraceae bacterium]|nr:hypothetical protein [Saprospiraceae bacterium]